MYMYSPPVHHQGLDLAEVLLQRLISNITESMLPELQCRFRKNRINMIFTARQLQEKCREQNQDLLQNQDLCPLLTSLKHSTVCKDSSYGCPPQADLTSVFTSSSQFHNGMTAQVTIGR